MVIANKMLWNSYVGISVFCISVLTSSMEACKLFVLCNKDIDWLIDWLSDRVYIDGRFIFIQVWSVDQLSIKVNLLVNCLVSRKTRNRPDQLIDCLIGCTESVTEFCGNNRVEGAELCDAGVGDRCCSESCQLIPPAVCRCALCRALSMSISVNQIFI